MKIYSVCITGALGIKRTAKYWLFSRSVTVCGNIFFNAYISSSHSFY